MRNALLTPIAMALFVTPSHAAMLLNINPVNFLPGSQGLWVYQINAVATAGETIVGFSNPRVTSFVWAFPQGVWSAHQVGTPILDHTTATRQDQLNAAPLWSDTWLPYDSYFYPTAANSVKIGLGTITETRSGTGESLPSAGLGPPPTGYGTISTVGGSVDYIYTNASGIPGPNVPIMQLVTPAVPDAVAVMVSMTLINSQGVRQFIPEPASISLLTPVIAALGVRRSRSIGNRRQSY